MGSQAAIVHEIAWGMKRGNETVSGMKRGMKRCPVLLNHVEIIKREARSEKEESARICVICGE